jgi:Flp pilus assembly CpaE family ATPase
MIRWLLKMLGFTAKPVKDFNLETSLPVELSAVEQTKKIDEVVDQPIVKKTRKPRQRKSAAKKSKI